VEERVLVWAPPRDGQLTRGFVVESGFECQTSRSWEELVQELQQGVGAVVIAGEFLTDSTVEALEEVLAAQPPWSDLPIIIVAGGDTPAEHRDAIRTLGNVSLLTRPVGPETLRSTVRAAVRARRRQYQMRDLLLQRDEAERRKDEFLAMLAHELRNPLAPLRTGLQLLQLNPPQDRVMRTYAMMERQIGNLARLVDDLLDVSRITRGKIALKRRLLDVRDGVHQAVDAARHLASEKALQLDVSMPGSPLMVDADPVRLEQMVGNLIGNAVKYTPSGGTILVSVEQEAEWAVIRVRDTGIGIAPEHLPHVFDLFTQATRTLDRTLGGLGIGLTVVRLLADLHEGSVSIASEGTDRGTEAMIRLPVCRQPEVPVMIPRDVVTSRASGRRVLIIEDNVDFAEMLSSYLQLAGHEVLTAHDGHAGLEAALRLRPHVVVCDIGLPGLDGYRVARRLRSEPALDSPLLIAITGYGDVAERDKSRAAGFAYHLTKPADPVRVGSLIAAHR
jgi:signal transduction histidine kinase